MASVAQTMVRMVQIEDREGAATIPQISRVGVGLACVTYNLSD